jgi:hypothetical protein
MQLSEESEGFSLSLVWFPYKSCDVSAQLDALTADPCVGVLSRFDRSDFQNLCSPTGALS